MMERLTTGVAELKDNRGLMRVLKIAGAVIAVLGGLAGLASRATGAVDSRYTLHTEFLRHIDDANVARWRDSVTAGERFDLLREAVQGLRAQQAASRAESDSDIRCLRGRRNFCR